MLKKIAICAIAFSCSLLGSAQNVEVCEKIIPIIVQAIEDGSSEKIEEHLDSRFRMAGHEGEIARTILRQLLMQLSDKVTDYEMLNQSLQDKTLTLEYEFNYEKLGTKQATFVFNEEGKIIDLTLLSMKVMKMDKDSEIARPSDSVIEVPFELVGSLISLKVSVDGKEMDFLLDTGAPVVVLNSVHFQREEGDDTQFRSSVKGVNGSISGLQVVELESLSFAGIGLTTTTVAAMDLAHLETELGARVDGLIGYEMIKNYDILFDYERSVLTLIEPDSTASYQTKNLQEYSAMTVPLEMQGHIPVVQAKIGEKQMSFGIDSGAETNLIDDDFKSILESNILDAKVDTLVGAGSEASETLSCKIDKVHIGEHDFVDLPTVLSDISHLNAGYSLDLDGLIGYEVLSKQKTLMSFNREELIFYLLED